MANGTPGQNQARPLRRSPGTQGSSNLMNMLVLIAVPWLIFVVMLILFSYLYHRAWTIVWIIVSAALVGSIIFIVLNSRDKAAGSWYLFLGLLCMFAVTWGSVAGLYNYYTHMFQFYSYDESRAYTNVLPSEPASGHADAGKIVFATAAKIDTTRAVGYKEASVYCVAPILDDSQVDRVQYWAAGIDCCPMRGDFACDDAWNPKARSGVVVLEPGGPLASNHAMYMKAVHTAVQAYSLETADEPLLVRWVLNPQGIQNDFYSANVGFIVAAVCIYLLLSVVFGAIFQTTSRRSAAASNSGQQHSPSPGA